jgi:hypothetical protein
MEEVVMSRFVRILLLCAAMLAVVPPATSLAATGLDADLGTLWTKVLETPSPQNSFGTGGEAFACWDLGNPTGLGSSTVAPFGPSGVASCTVTAGTSIFVAASSFECSTFEGNGTTEQQLATCARQNDAQTQPTVTVDGKPVTVSQAETGLLNVVLPANNVFGSSAGTQGFSFAHGWVTLLRPLPVGTHTIVITNGQSVITTTITVRPHQ